MPLNNKQTNISKLTNFQLETFLYKIKSYIRDDILFSSPIPQKTDPNAVIFDVSNI